MGIRLPVTIGVTFASVAPMLAMAGNPALGLTPIVGPVIAAGLFGILIAPFIGSSLRFFPSVATGSIITMIGITMTGTTIVGINWIGGVFDTFPRNPFYHNVGLLGMTGVTSPILCVAGGGIVILLGLLSKAAFIAASVSQSKLGSAESMVFGIVAATGIRILRTMDHEKQRGTLIIVACAIGFGLTPRVAPTLFRAPPEMLRTLLDSGILLATIAAVALNASFNGAAAATGAPAVASDHI